MLSYAFKSSKKTLYELFNSAGGCSNTGEHIYIYIGYGWYHASLLKMVHRWQLI